MSDGHTFPIETVRDFRPAGTADNGYSGDCFTVLIQGQEKPSFSSASYDSLSLAADPSLELSYLVAPPRMAYYEKVSRQIYGIYLKYIAPEDIVVYSIDEVFIDATSYLSHYNMTAHDLAMTMIREVLYTTGITATAGIGTNLYLAKLAMDITAKHAAPDKDGVRIAELDEESFRYLLWDHKPLTESMPRLRSTNI